MDRSLSADPKDWRVALGGAPVETVLVVADSETLLDRAWPARRL